MNKFKVGDKVIHINCPCGYKGKKAVITGVCSGSYYEVKIIATKKIFVSTERDLELIKPAQQEFDFGEE